jgi:hypothetical protein
LSKKFQSNSNLLIKVINDLSDFMPYLVIVGGWVPYIYAKYIWKNVPNMAVTTGDIDFGVGAQDFKGKDTVSSRVQKLDYGERHVSMDRPFPFVPIVKDAAGDVKAEVEFITDPKISKDAVNKIMGTAIKINKIKYFGLLLNSVITVKMENKDIRMPTEAMFTFHKPIPRMNLKITRDVISGACGYRRKQKRKAVCSQSGFLFLEEWNSVSIQGGA